LDVKDTIRPYEGCIALQLQGEENLMEGLRIHGDIAIGNTVQASVDHKHRSGNRRNHTATHLLNAALRTILPKHSGRTAVTQASSLVTPQKLHFDFTSSALSAQQTQAVEDWVNEAIAKDVRLNTKEVSYQEATSSGDVVFLAGEQYGETVRVVEVDGLSKELCGGTHAESTGQLQLFKIISEKSAASGIRRIEAVTGQEAVHWYSGIMNKFNQVSSMMSIQPSQLEDSIVKLMKDKETLERDLQSLFLKLDVKEDAIYENILPVHLHSFPQTTSTEGVDFLVPLVQKLCSLDPNVIHFVICGTRVLCAIDEKKYPHLKAGTMIMNLFKEVGGKGGGTKTWGQGQLPQETKEPSIELVKKWSSLSVKS